MAEREHGCNNGRDELKIGYGDKALSLRSSHLILFLLCVLIVVFCIYGWDAYLRPMREEHTKMVTLLVESARRITEIERRVNVLYTRSVNGRYACPELE